MAVTNDDSDLPDREPNNVEANSVGACRRV
jgi:hypothetical protein